MNDAEKMQEAWLRLLNDPISCWTSREIFKAGYQAAKAESPWVPIADIPEEWKDGRQVDLLLLRDPRPFSISLADSFKQQSCIYYKSQWHSEWTPNGTKQIPQSYITHAMLPPSPPKEGYEA